MKTIKSYFINRSPAILFIIFISAVMGFSSCKNEKKKSRIEAVEEEVDNAIEIITENMDFQMPDTISSGWNTFRYKNMSPQTHFFLVDKYPEGKTLDDAVKYVIPPFTEGMKLLNEGKSEEGFAEFGKLPEWFGEVKFLGGSGLISPGGTAEATIKLDPGYYLIECYVKMSNGIFHSSMGMIKPLIVADSGSGNAELKADVAIDISGEEGIVFNDSITAGKHIFSVFFKDQMVHENFVGHDINLARLEAGADQKILEQWMNWVDPKGLIEPAPEGITFLGGINDMPAGQRGYFTATLEPGQYVLVSEVPNAMEKNMLKVFTVSAQP